jgi:PAS domain-containing protein
MSRLATELERQTKLRQRAESRITVGSRSVGGLASASAALGVLFDLASSPATAPKALALLHELQVHQVELDLQDEELRNARDELEVALSRHVALYDHAPVSYLTLDGATVMHEINLTCAHLLGRGREELLGSPLSRFLLPRSTDDLQTLLARVHDGQPEERCTLLVQPLDRTQRVVHATASADPVAGRFLVVLVDLGKASATTVK